MGSLPSFWKYNIVFISGLAYIFLILTVREDFYRLFGLFSVVFVCYILIVNEYKIKDVFYMAVIFRLLWLFTAPNLSDDYYRFLWDGEMICQLENPFKNIPSDLIDREEIKNPITEELYNNMNSPDYHTVYPPTNQMLFLTSALGDSVGSRILILKIFFFLIEFLGLFVLFKLAETGRIGSSKFSLWALNPLVIIEGVGNLHFEVIVLTFIILAIVFFQRNLILSAIFYGLAISTKLLPLMFLPLLIPYLGWKKGIKYGAAALGVFVMSFVPFFDLELIKNLWSSLDLYFQNFEFNASIFYIVKWIGELIVGWDIVGIAGPCMALVTILTIAYFSLIPKNKVRFSLSTTALIVSTIYLLMSTTVHPWYAIIPFGISIFSGHKFATWWTGLIFLSYSFYINGTIEEKPLFLFIQYVALFVLIIVEIRANQPSNKTISYKGIKV